MRVLLAMVIIAFSSNQPQCAFALALIGWKIASEIYEVRRAIQRKATVTNTKGAP